MGRVPAAHDQSHGGAAAGKLRPLLSAALIVRDEERFLEASLR